MALVSGSLVGGTVAEAYARCAELARAHYENFTVGSWLLPRDKRRHVYAIYAFCRFVDDLGDEHRADRLEALDAWQQDLLRCYEGDPRHSYLVALRETIREFDIPQEPFLKLIEANRMDQTVTRYPTYRDLDFYCQHSANPVGHLMLHVFGYRDVERRRLSDYTCTALQLANFWQDVDRDHSMGRIYIPLEEWTLAEAAFQGPLTPVDWQRTVREHHRRVEEHPRRRSTPFPLSGIAWCVDCDAPFRGTTVGGYRYYRCGGFRFLGQEYTTSHYIRDFALHRQMGEYLQELAEDPAKLDILLAGEWGEEEDNWEAQQGALLRQQDELLRRRRRWQDAYEAAAINLLDFAERMKKIEKEEAAIERQLQEIEDQQERAQEQEDQESLIHQAIANIPLLLGGELTGEDREILRAMFSRLVHRVLIKDKQVIDMKFKT